MTKKKTQTSNTYGVLKNEHTNHSLTIFPQLIQKFGFTITSVFGKIFDMTQSYEQSTLLDIKKNEKDLVLIINNTYVNDFDDDKMFSSSLFNFYLSQAQGFFYRENGQVWICMSHHQWVNQLWNAFSVKTIRRTLNELVKHGLIIKTRDHIAASTQIFAFSINFEILQSILKNDKS